MEESSKSGVYALVQLTTKQKPVHLLNPMSEPIRVYNGIEIATLKGVEVSRESVSFVDNVQKCMHMISRLYTCRRLPV